MPYDAKSGQAIAAFMNIKRKKGASAARAFGRKHAADMSAAEKARKGKHGKHRRRGYMSRRARGDVNMEPNE